MTIDKNLLRLNHILESIRRIEVVTENLSYGDYINDWQKQDIIIRNMEIIGEASRQVDDDFKAKYPDVEWRQATAMRNFLIHEYFNVEYDEVWTTLKKDLPHFKIRIQEIFNDINIIK
ncbi:MAG: DUF86 domain-containing protein [Bergeyella zoohelcum]|nr:DUF86 domain-containing protein [Bergeyella zoohelcum]